MNLTAPPKIADIQAASAMIRKAVTTLDGVEIVEAQSPGLGWHTLARMDDGDLPTLPRPVLSRVRYGFAVEVRGHNAAGRRHGHYGVHVCGVAAWVLDTRLGYPETGHERAVFRTAAEARAVALELLWNGQTFAIRRARL